VSANVKSNQAFGAAPFGPERPAPAPAPLFDRRKRRLAPGEAWQLTTRDARASRAYIEVIQGRAHGFWSSTHGGTELPDMALAEGLRVYEFAPRPVELTLYNPEASGGQDLFVSVLLTNPEEKPAQGDACCPKCKETDECH
jgi:hypothetical protein